MATKKTAALAASALELSTVDPTTLGVDDQVRADATPDAELIASVQRFGVLQPPTVYWDADREQHIVVIGHRRVGAAIAAKLPQIQVLVRDAAEAKDALRLEQQLVENERRAALTPADVARGYKDLNLFGLRPEDIAAAVSEKPERVTAALKATTSTKATAALDRGIDLEQAALIAEFDGDPGIQDILTDVALDNPGNFAYRVDTARASQAAAAKVATFAEKLAAEGCPLIGTVRWNDSYWNGDGKTVPHGQGRSLDRMGIHLSAHKSCPGHAAIIHNASSDTYAEIVYVCTDYKGHGHDGEPELTAEQLEQQQELARQREQDRIANEAYDANANARREWLRGFITGRLNQTAGIFDLIAAATIGAGARDTVDPLEGYPNAIYILTGEIHSYDYGDTPLADMINDGRITSLRALVAIALGVCERFAARPGPARYSAPHLVSQYFDHLKTWGYTFSDIDTEIHSAALAGIAAEEGLDVDGDDE